MKATIEHIQLQERMRKLETIAGLFVEFTDHPPIAEKIDGAFDPGIFVDHARFLVENPIKATAKTWELEARVDSLEKIAKAFIEFAEIPEIASVRTSLSFRPKTIIDAAKVLVPDWNTESELALAV